MVGELSLVTAVSEDTSRPWTLIFRHTQEFSILSIGNDTSRGKPE